MTRAEEFYQQWVKRNKLDLSVKSNEQMFIIGYESRDEDVRELSELVVDLMAEIQKLKKPKKAKTNADV
jgi:hypothetical protein